MKTKKWNARLALFSAGLLVIHSLYQAIAYLTMYYNPVISAVTGFALAGAVLLHAILSAVSVFKLHDSKIIAYKKLNIKTVLQRATAIIIVLLLPLHIISFNLLKSSLGTVWYGLTEMVQILFYAAVYSHFALSFTNALITLGKLENINTKRKIDILLYVVCAVMFIITSTVITLMHTKIFQ